MWIKKYHKLEKQVDWVKKLADKLEQSNKQYSEWDIISTLAVLTVGLSTPRGKDLLLTHAVFCTFQLMCVFICFLFTVAENQRLTLNFTSQEEDRALLVKQLVLVKRDNARYKEELAQLKESMGKDESDKQNRFPRQSSSKKQQNSSDGNVRSVKNGENRVFIK